MTIVGNSTFFAYKGKDGISIAMTQPRNCNFPVYKSLQPGWNLLNLWKQGKITEDEYTEIYKRDILSKLDINKVRKDLKGKVLLCWEPSGFCHRFIACDWINIEQRE